MDIIFKLLKFAVGVALVILAVAWVSNSKPRRSRWV